MDSYVLQQHNDGKYPIPVTDTKMLIGNGDYGDRDGGETEMIRTMPRETEMVPVTANTRVVTETSRREDLQINANPYKPPNLVELNASPSTYRE
jgi:hypothetical protein